MNATTSSRFLQGAVLALLTLVIALGATVAVLATQNHTAAPARTTISTAHTNVSDFNDGYATSKQDDCQQGDANACAWLKANKTN